MSTTISGKKRQDPLQREPVKRSGGLNRQRSPPDPSESGNFQTGCHMACSLVSPKPLAHAAQNPKGRWKTGANVASQWPLRRSPHPIASLLQVRQLRLQLLDLHRLLVHLTLVLGKPRSPPRQARTQEALVGLRANRLKELSTGEKLAASQRKAPESQPRPLCRRFGPKDVESWRCWFSSILSEVLGPLLWWPAPVFGLRGSQRAQASPGRWPRDLKKSGSRLIVLYHWLVLRGCAIQESGRLRPPNTCLMFPSHCLRGVLIENIVLWGGGGQYAIGIPPAL